FDQFWNSDLAYPVHTLVKKEPVCAGPVSATALPTPAGPATDPPDVPATGPTEVFRAGRLQLSWVPAEVLADEPSKSSPEGALPHPAGPARAPADGPTTGLTEVFRDGRLQLSWVPAKVLADEPSKISPEGEPPDPEEVIADDVIGLTRAARREVILISPYFVPGKRGAAMFRDLRARGVRVRVLTNSLAATDAPIVHVGYARYRAELLAEGVELHELRNRLGRPRSRLGSFGSSQASLHAKAMVVDRRILLVGSMNMDPRSELHNTELALVLRSQALSAQVVRLFEDVAASSSYRVEAMADGRLRWVGEAPDVPTVEGSEPDAGIALKLLLKLLSPLAPD